MERSRFIKVTFLLGACALVSKLLGLLREIVLAALFGATESMDAFAVADLLAGIVGYMIMAGIGMVVIPVYSGYMAQYGQEECDKFSSNALSVMLLMFVIVGSLCMIYADSIVEIGAPGLSTQAHEMAVSLFKLILPGLIFSVLYILAAAIQHCHGQFLYPALAGLPSNLALILVTCMLAESYGIAAAALANTAALAMQAAIQWPGLKHCVKHWNFHVWPLHPGVKQAGLLLLPLFLSNAASQTSLIIERMLASSLPVGVISAVMYAGKVNAAFAAFCLAPILTVIFPVLSRNISEGNQEEFRDNLKTAIRAVCFCTLPTAALIMTNSMPLVELLFERGRFDRQATEATAYAVQYLALGLTGLCLSEVFIRSFYARRDMWTPAKIAIITMALTILLDLTLIPYMQQGGLALAVSVSASVGTWLLFRLLQTKGSLSLSDRGLGRDVGIIAVSALVMVAEMEMTEFLLTGGPLPAAQFHHRSTTPLLITKVVTGGITFLTMAYWMGSREAAHIWRIIRKIRLPDQIYRIRQ